MLWNTADSMQQISALESARVSLKIRRAFRGDCPPFFTDHGNQVVCLSLRDMVLCNPATRSTSQFGVISHRSGRICPFVPTARDRADNLLQRSSEHLGQRPLHLDISAHISRQRDMDTALANYPVRNNLDHAPWKLFSVQFELDRYRQPRFARGEVPYGLQRNDVPLLLSAYLDQRR